MRNAFIAELEKQAEFNEKIILLVGDIGFGVFEKFIEKYPDRYINMGIAEQNMVSVAAGLAKEGYSPVVYTIIPFLTMRAFEQIRVDIGMHERKLLLVGVGGGYSYDILGPTHHALEDIALMRAIPGMKVFTPGNPNQISAARTEIFNFSAPSYLRLGKNGEKNFDVEPFYSTEWGTEILGEDSEIALVSHGPVSREVELARKALFELNGIASTHYAVIRNEPSPKTLFEKIIGKAGKVFFIEENYETGSLYSEFLNVLVQNPGNSVNVKAIHPTKAFYSRVAPRDEILKDLGMDSQSLYAYFAEILSR